MHRLLILFCFFSFTVIAVPPPPVKHLTPEQEAILKGNLKRLDDLKRRLGEKMAEQRPAPLFKFPCEDELDLAKAALPIIVINGERHYTPASIVKRKELKEKADRGECVLTAEGLYCRGAEKPQMEILEGVKDYEGVLGFDDPFTHGLTSLFIAFENMEGKAEERTNGTMGILEAITVNEYAKEAFDLLQKDFPPEFLEKSDPSEKKIVDLFALMSKGSFKDAQQRLLDLNFKHPIITDRTAVKGVLKKWIRSYAKLAVNKYKKEKFVPEGLVEDIDKYLDGSDRNTAFEKVALTWRNQFMAANIAENYCKEALKPGKEGVPLEVITGDSHVDGLADLLSRMSGGRIKIEKKRVPIAQGTREILDSLEEARKLLEALRSGPPSDRRPGQTGELPGIGEEPPPPIQYNFSKPPFYGSPPGEGGEGSGAAEETLPVEKPRTSLQGTK